MFNKITIIGTGFMGASLAKDIKAKGIAKVVCGVVRNKERAQQIGSLGVFDDVTESLDQAFAETDLIVLAAPVGTIISLIKDRIDAYFYTHNNSKILITDLGSTKQSIVDVASKTSFADNFIGAHPICGSEKSGAENSVEGLYDGAECIVIESDNKDGLTLIESFWKSLGCNVSVMSAVEHDKILAATSHLPHAISFAYAKQVNPDYVKYSAGSFKDIIRISKSDQNLWDSIFSNNKKEVIAAIDCYIKSLNQLKKKIGKVDNDNSD